MGCGWAKGLWVLLAVSAWPVSAAADFVHLVPSDPHGKPSDSIVPASAEPSPTSQGETTLRTQRISTASDPQAVVTPVTSGRDRDAPVSSPPPDDWRQASPLPETSPAQGVRPIVLNSTGTSSGVPEPSMLAIALIASAGLLVRRRQNPARDADDRA